MCYIVYIDCVVTLFFYVGLYRHTRVLHSLHRMHDLVHGNFQAVPDKVTKCYGDYMGYSNYGHLWPLGLFPDVGDP